jgi:hypothetical protein
MMRSHMSLLHMTRRDWRDVIDVDGRLVRLGIRDGWVWEYGEVGERNRRYSASVAGLG